MMNVSLSFCQPSTLCTSKRQLLPSTSTPILFSFSHSHKKLRRFVTCASSSELPLLPFPIDQVLVPSETKTLHLYEARYLALLEESLFKKKKFFVHFVLDPIAINDTSGEASFAARYGCLVAIEKVSLLALLL
uniref:ATP-dependent peptidase n=1 Tax=Solanum tuberosum TaxID=4113 RepID=M1CJF0_SOLTU